MTENAEGLDGFIVKVLTPRCYIESVFAVAETASQALEKIRASYKEQDLEFSEPARARQLQPGVYVLGNLQPASYSRKPEP